MKEKNIIRINELDERAQSPLALTDEEALVLLSVCRKRYVSTLSRIKSGQIVKTQFGTYMTKEIYQKNNI